MKVILPAFVIAIVFGLMSCSPSQDNNTKIEWDTWGVPHVTASNIEDLFYAQGWAEMHNHANMITELYGSARGKGAEYWGQSSLPNDILIHTLGLPELADQWERDQDEETKKIFSAFVIGLNDYAQTHPEAIEDKNQVVLPLTTKDANLHALYVIFTRFIAGGDLGMVQQWKDMGSNTYAVGPTRSASGNALLVQNPHLPWYREFLFFESQLNLNGKRMYGSTLVGFPGIAIGFNENMGWSHTNNTIDNTDTYELELKDGGYLLDGEKKDFTSNTKTLKIKQEDGTFADHEITIEKTLHGPVVKKSGRKALAIRMAGTDRPDMFQQWWRMINSTNFNEFESALKMAQIPFWNVMYADKEKNIFYLFNGLVPKRSEGDWSYWDRVIPGGKSSDIWNDVHAYEDLPKVMNPEIGWLQNANDPPWTSTIPLSLNPDDFPPYMAPRNMAFRPQRAARMMMEDSSITYDQLVDYKLSTRSEFADRIMDDLFAAIDKSNAAKAKEAKAVLEKWDREADSDSKGTVLFYSWARKYRISPQENYTTPWDINRPMETPDGLADPKRAVDLLVEAANEVEKTFGSLDVAWGDYYRIAYAGKDLPANGIDGAMGVFRVAWSGGEDEQHSYVGGGDSWVGVIEFGEKPKAKVLLSYGNSTQKDSPHFGDQLELFSKKELRDAWFTDEEVKAHTEKVEVLTENGFVEEQNN